MSLTKLAATTAHALMAAGFAVITWRNGFVSELWLIYTAAALGHAMYDKTAAQVSAFKARQLDAEAVPSE
jgi:hypothetical protein